MHVASLRQIPELGRRGRESRPTHPPRLEDTPARLPRDVGLVLICLGAAGLVIPGPIPPGTPFLLAGVVFTCPVLVKRFGGCLLRRFPALYAGLNDQARRFRTDLERRYPGSTGPC